ncbi:MAG: hypothetical protein HUN04_02710 [Desulfobacter sp.]|nr:MAG: hypothetical protein HUN04_02710 [Desulfobacter sp.]
MKLLRTDPEKGTKVIAESDNIPSLKSLASRLCDGENELNWESGQLPKGGVCSEEISTSPLLHTSFRDGSSFVIED